MKPIIMALMTIAFTGCAATSTFETGRDFDIGKSTLIVSDKTTMSDVLKMLGQPFSKKDSAQIQTWGYFYVRSLGNYNILSGRASSNALSKQLTIVFDSLGVVRSQSSAFSGE